jgi:hypothetical protein
MQLKLLGNSGCLLRVVEKDDVLFVRKTTGNRDYSLRLFRQALKQRSFQSVSADTDVTSPRVTAINLGGGKCEFEMEYCNADDFVSYLQCADRAGIDRVADKLVSFIESGIARSPVTSVPSRVLLDKYLPLRKRFRREYPARPDLFERAFYER